MLFSTTSTSCLVILYPLMRGREPSLPHVYINALAIPLTHSSFHWNPSLLSVLDIIAFFHLSNILFFWKLYYLLLFIFICGKRLEYMYVMHLQCPERPENTTGFLKTGISHGFELPCRYCKLNLVPLQEQNVSFKCCTISPAPYVFCKHIIFLLTDHST